MAPSGATIIRSESKNDRIYVILRGYCRMESHLPGDLERKISSVKETGYLFPFLSGFYDALAFENVIAVTCVELLLIPTEILLKAFDRYQLDNGSFKKTLEYHQNTYKSFIYKTATRLPKMSAAQRSEKGKGNIFKYNVYDMDVVAFTEEIYLQPFLSLGEFTNIFWVFYPKHKGFIENVGNCIFCRSLVIRQILFVAQIY